MPRGTTWHQARTSRRSGRTSKPGPRFTPCTEACPAERRHRRAAASPCACRKDGQQPVLSERLRASALHHPGGRLVRMATDRTGQAAAFHHPDRPRAAGRAVPRRHLGGPTAEGGACCAIITEPSFEQLAFIHARQPLALDATCRWDWLDPAITGREQVRHMTRRLPPSALQAYPVSTRVNRPQNDAPSVLGHTS